jgi:hypothetical protein
MTDDDDSAQELALSAHARLSEMAEKIEALSAVREALELTRWLFGEILDAVEDHDIPLSEEVDAKIGRLDELLSQLTVY